MDAITRIVQEKGSVRSMRMKMIDVIRKSDDRMAANLIGAIVAIHGDGISAEEALSFEYNETLKALQSELEVDYKQTNADRIRAMSDEELAEFMYSSDIPWCDDKICREDDNGCRECLKKWLRSEVEVSDEQ